MHPLVTRTLISGVLFLMATPNDAQFNLLRSTFNTTATRGAPCGDVLLRFNYYLRSIPTGELFQQVASGVGLRFEALGTS